MDTNLRKTFWSVPLAILVSFVMAGCGATSSTQQAPPAVSAAYLGYVDALRAGDGPRACGLATVHAQELLVGQAIAELGPERFPGAASGYCQQVVAGYAASVRRFDVPVVNSGHADGDQAELIVTQPYKDATNLKRRIVLKQVQGRWLFDGIYNLALTKQ